MVKKGLGRKAGVVGEKWPNMKQKIKNSEHEKDRNDNMLIEKYYSQIFDEKSKEEERIKSSAQF